MRTRIGNEHNEDALLMIAEHGTAAHVERLVRAYRSCQEAEQRRMPSMFFLYFESTLSPFTSEFSVFARAA